MNSTAQSAETMVANGLTLNIKDVDIGAPKLNKSGGKSANVIYLPTKKALYVNCQVPMLTWGATMFKDQQSGKETYDMAIQFPRKDYSTPETDRLLTSFQALEEKIKAAAITNSVAWFNKKTMTPEVVNALWTPMLKYPKDPESGEPDVTKSPTLKIKLPMYDGKFECEIYDPAGNMLYPSKFEDTTPVDLIPKGVNIVAIIQCGGLWFANGKFGCTWRLFQVVVQPKPSMKGRCLIATTPAPAPAPAGRNAAVSQGDDEGEMVVVDSDEEEEEPAAAPAAPAPAVVVQAKVKTPEPEPEPVQEEPVAPPHTVVAAVGVAKKLKVTRKPAAADK
jgi:hypothetical protein